MQSITGHHRGTVVQTDNDLERLSNQRREEIEQTTCSINTESLDWAVREPTETFDTLSTSYTTNSQQPEGNSFKQHQVCQSQCTIKYKLRVKIL